MNQENKIPKTPNQENEKRSRWLWIVVTLIVIVLAIVVYVAVMPAENSSEETSTTNTTNTDASSTNTESAIAPTIDTSFLDQTSQEVSALESEIDTLVNDFDDIDASEDSSLSL